MERVYNKLVRDRIPEIIRAQGETPVIRTLDDVAYAAELARKLEEECREVIAASGGERVEELADVLEVIKHLAQTENVTLEQIIALAEEKSARRGGFAKRVFLEKVIE